MITIKGIDAQTEHYEDVRPEEKEKLAFPTFRQLFISCLGGLPADNGEQAIDMYELGRKIKKAKEDYIELEDAEFKLLMEKVKKFPKWGAFYQAQVLLKLKEAEEAKKETK